MKDEYIAKIAAIASELSEASKELMDALEWYSTDSKTLYLNSEQRAWRALNVALEIIKHDKPEVLKQLTTLALSSGKETEGSK